MKARIAILLAVTASTGCTFGAPGASISGGSAATTIDVNLTQHAPLGVSFGTSGGYAPPVTTVAVGTSIRFVNSDSFAHTASSVPGAIFPAASPLNARALTPSADGARLSAGFSSGNLAAGAASAVFVADAPGTYLYGCFYHYGAPMRGAIVVR